MVLGLVAPSLSGWCVGATTKLHWRGAQMLKIAPVVAVLALAVSACTGQEVAEPQVAPVPTPAQIAERISVAQVTSRDDERLDRHREKLKQVRIEARQEARQEARREARQEAREEAAPEPTVAQAGAGGCSGLPADLTMVCNHESGGNPQAYNATGCLGGCYGLFQMSGEYMDSWAASAGYGDYAYAGHWPVDVQKAVALWMYSQPNGLHVYWCDFTSYC